MGYRIGVDIGGTFIDFCLFDESTGDLRTLKVLTTPATPGSSSRLVPTVSTPRHPPSRCRSRYSARSAVPGAVSSCRKMADTCARSSGDA